MPTLTVTNISSEPVHLRDFYITLSPGQTVSQFRTPNQIMQMKQIIEGVRSGILELNLSPSEAEKHAGFYPYPGTDTPFTVGPRQAYQSIQEAYDQAVADIGSDPDLRASVLVYPNHRTKGYDERVTLVGNSGVHLQGVVEMAHGFREWSNMPVIKQGIHLAGGGEGLFYPASISGFEIRSPSNAPALLSDDALGKDSANLIGQYLLIQGANNGFPAVVSAGGVVDLRQCLVRQDAANTNPAVQCGDPDGSYGTSENSFGFMELIDTTVVHYGTFSATDRYSVRLYDNPENIIECDVRGTSHLQGPIKVENNGIFAARSGPRLESDQSEPVIDIDAGGEVRLHNATFEANSGENPSDPTYAIVGSGDLWLGSVDLGTTNHSHSPGIANLDPNLTVSNIGPVYHPTTDTDWTSPPDNMQDALDELASRVTALEP